MIKTMINAYEFNTRLRALSSPLLLTFCGSETLGSLASAYLSSHKKEL